MRTYYCDARRLIGSCSLKLVLGRPYEPLQGAIPEQRYGLWVISLRLAGFRDT